MNTALDRAGALAESLRGALRRSLPIPLVIGGQGPFWRAPSRVRLRTLIFLRWMAVAGQTAALIFVQYGLGFDLPMGAALAAVAASAWVNLALMFALPSQRLVTEWEAALQLAYDLLQLAMLIGLTGGAQNPFMLMFIAPVAVSAVALRPIVTGGLAALAFACVGVLAFWHAPLPWFPGESFQPHPLYLAGHAAAVLVGLGFTGVYAWRVASEEERLIAALNAAQAVLAQEQRLSALGGLAAAAAHELGTPLATIHLVAKEMSRSTPQDSPLREDVDLLVSQSERCREILARLSARPDEGDAVHARHSLSALLDEVVFPRRDGRVRIEVTVTAKGAEEREPDLRRMPEIIYGLGNLVDNALDFARTKVEIVASWGPDEIEIIVRDDGPGFTLGVLTRLGEPYVSERSGDRAVRRAGMGLGFFIAKTLLEKTEARVNFRNRAGGGAMVRMRWRREALEAR